MTSDATNTERMRQRRGEVLARIPAERLVAATMAAVSCTDAHDSLMVLERFAEGTPRTVDRVDLSVALPELKPQPKPAPPPRSTLYGLTMLDTMKAIAQLVASLGGTGLSVHWHARDLVEAMRELPRAAHGMQAHVLAGVAGRIVWAAVDLGEVSFRAQYFEADEVKP